MLRILPFSLILLFVLFSCTLITDSGINEDFPGDEHVTWVQMPIMGGQQCNFGDDFVPPDTKKMLNQIGIPVFAEVIQHQPVCGACSCPSYAAIHYALIPVDKVERALAADFELSDGPEN